MADDKEASTMDDVRAAYESLETPAEAPAVPAETVEAPAEETAGQKAERERDEQGRFAKQPESKEPKRETLTLKTKQTAPQAAPTVSPPTASAPAAPFPPEIDKDGKHLARIAPPPGWEGVANIAWDRMPRPVREAVANKYAEVESARQELLPLKEMFDVHREFLVSQAGSVQEAQRQMLMFARMSVDNPVQLAEHILRARGIDPRAAFSGQPQASAQGQQQDVQSLLAQLVDQRLQPLLAEREQQQTQQLQTTIDQFGADPKHPFFNDVRVHMGQLISAGAAKTLDDAYEQATWANKPIREHLMEEQRGAAEAAKAAEVAKARKAQASSVTGSPLPGAAGLNGKTDPKASALDDVRAAFNELSGA
jgi:hypothetical protein